MTLRQMRDYADKIKSDAVSELIKTHNEVVSELENELCSLKSDHQTLQSRADTLQYELVEKARELRIMAHKQQ